MTRRDAIGLTIAAGVVGTLAPIDDALWQHVWPPARALIAQTLGAGISFAAIMALGCWVALLIDPPER